MSYSDIDLPRRRWLRQGAALLAGGCALVASAGASEADSRFADIDAPAVPVRCPAQAVLTAVATAGDALVAVGERGIVLRSKDGGRSWLQSAHVPTSVTLTAVRFTDASTGWTVGHLGVVLSTRDGGVTWRKVIDGRGLAQVAKASADARAAAGDARADALQKEAALLVADGPDKPLLDILAISADHVVVVGAYNLCFETRDGGTTWTSLLDRVDNPKGHHWYAITARGDTWLLAGEQGLLQISRDAGASFRALASPYAGSWFAVTTPKPGTWIVGGLRGNAWISQDDGARWARLEGPAMSSFVSALPLPGGRSLLATQGGQVFVVGNSSALRPLKVPDLPPVAQMIALPGGAALAVGMGGALRIEGLLA